MPRRRKQRGVDVQGYDRRELRRLFGLAPSTIALLERQGLLPVRDKDSRARYEFGDLVLMRMVGALHAAKLPPRTINRALRRLKPWISETLPLGRFVLDVVDRDVAVRQGEFRWSPDSGQYALPLEVRALGAHVLVMKRRKTLTGDVLVDAHDHYLRAADLEADDVTAAKLAYQQCLAGDCAHLEARINLGRLLHLEGKHREAESVYRGTGEPHAVLFFNLGVLLEDLNQSEEAMQAYRDAIVHDPGLADAHFNLSLLHERAGQTQAAFRHLLAYRRLLRTEAAAGA